MLAIKDDGVVLWFVTESSAMGYIQDYTSNFCMHLLTRDRSLVAI